MKKGDAIHPPYARRYPRPVAEPVERDSRGIIEPAAARAHFDLRRADPSPSVGRFVERYWVAEWGLPDGTEFTQQVLVHPVVNLVFGDGFARVGGVRRERWERVLVGRGEVLGVMFRPGGFSPFSDRDLDALTDRELPLHEVLGPDAVDLDDAVRSAAGDADRMALVDRFLAERVPAERVRSEDLSDLVDTVRSDPSVQRVSTLAELAGCTPRQLQRRFAEHVGVGPKWVVRRYRLYEAAERAAHDHDIDWAALAAELGYADQAHLTRDFTSAVGLSPQRYAERCRAGAPPVASFAR